MVAVKVENGDLWQRVKAGELRGFSIEGYFADRLINKVETPTNEEMSILTQIRELLAKTNLFAEDQLQDGTKIVTEAEAFEPGVIVNVIDEEGNPTPAPAGEHTLMNGTIIVVGEGGRLESVGKKEEQEPAQPLKRWPRPKRRKMKKLKSVWVTTANALKRLLLILTYPLLLLIFWLKQLWKWLTKSSKKLWSLLWKK